MIVLLKTKRRDREKMLAPEHTKGVCVVVEMCWLDKVTMSSDNLKVFQYRKHAPPKETW